MKYFRTDAESILSHIKRQEKQIKLKRRWLMGVVLTRSERKKLNKSKNFQNLFLSESLLREDDIFYESVRTRVEGAFGARRVETENRVSPDDMHLIRIPNIKLKRLISSCLNNLTTKGLYRLAVILAGGSIKSEITRCNLKKIIKGSLSSVLGRKSNDRLQTETRKQLFQLITNPQHFRDGREPLSALKFQSDHVAVEKVLHGLKNLPSQALIAMHRKLKGEKAPMPQLQRRKCGWGRDRLIKMVKKFSREMLLQLGKGNELPEPLAKAMAIADLSQKLTTSCHSIFSKEFYQFSPEVKFLQNDIMNAIWSVEKVVPLPVLRNLQLLIEPEAVISTRSLRPAFASFLTEFLFECSDMDSIPKSLRQILDSINRSSNSTHDILFQKKYIEEEVDCILSVSAQTKQIVLDLLPDHEFDQNFTDAYMELLEDSEEDSGSDEDDDNNQLQEDTQFINGTSNSMDLNFKAESIGDFLPFQFHPSTSMTQENGESEEHFSTPIASKNATKDVSPDRKSDENEVRRHDFNESDTELDPRDAANLFCEETEPIPTKDSLFKNQYLAIQDSCDKTSMLAYNLIGHILEEFAIIEGLDLNLRKLYLTGGNQVEDVEETKKKASSGKHVGGSTIVRVIKELIPSFPDSGMEKLKKLMAL